MPEIHYTRFPATSLVANLMATSRCRPNGIWETTRHNGLLPAATCYRLVANLLRGCRQLVTDLQVGDIRVTSPQYGVTGVMDLGLLTAIDVTRRLPSAAMTMSVAVETRSRITSRLSR